MVKPQVVPKEREGLDELNQDLWRDPRKANETVRVSAQSKRNMQNVDGNCESYFVSCNEM